MAAAKPRAEDESDPPPDPPPIGEQTDEQLRETRAVGLASFRARWFAARIRMRELVGNGREHGLIQQAVQQDAAIADALATLQAATDPRIELRRLEKFDPASPDIAILRALVPAHEALEQAYFSARAANSAVAALDAEKIALEQSMRLDEAIPEERGVRLAVGELMRRGRPIVPPGLGVAAARVNERTAPSRRR